MHFTLTVRFSLISQVSAAGVLAATVVFLEPSHPALWIAIALSTGAVTGGLRSRAMRQSSQEALRAADGVLPTARILEATPAGRWSLWIGWAALTVPVALAIGGVPTINLDAVIAFASASLLAHEIFCLPALLALRTPAPKP